MNTTAAENHRAWCQREARREAVALYAVAHLTIPQALASGLTLPVAQRVINWQQRTRG